jgi:phosphate starvation-inducible protein PhoH|tara:strand:+ start:353 stop:1126 length:774 start_codon:yes stop_codon:yes gene_type:complete
MYNNSNLAFVDDYAKFNNHKTKKQKRKEKKKSEHKPNIGMVLRSIQPKTSNQSRTFTEYQRGNHLLLQGVAGTGKTFISSYLAMNEVFNQNTGKQKLVIVRSVVPTRDMGFLPGSQKEKQKAYELPYISIFTELFGRGDAYDVFKNKNMVEFISTSFIRGITLSDSIVLVDECQNLTFHELDSIVTRIGENTRIIFSGDFRQSDLERSGDRQGILDFMKIVNSIKGFETINFVEEDIVRSELVKSYIIAKLNEGIYY